MWGLSPLQPEWINAGLELIGRIFIRVEKQLHGLGDFQDGTCINLEELCSGSCFVKKTKFLLKCSQASPWKPP